MKARFMIGGGLAFLMPSEVFEYHINFTFFKDNLPVLTKIELELTEYSAALEPPNPL